MKLSMITLQALAMAITCTSAAMIGDPPGLSRRETNEAFCHDIVCSDKRHCLTGGCNDCKIARGSKEGRCVGDGMGAFTCNPHKCNSRYDCPAPCHECNPKTLMCE
ncbi:unnamed protein product [Zymoseptoria tritici ST99CH_3D1]|uniref:TNFR-Cys domain-containing protein n=1 Tax=Zymoseptoria tritici (strain ST99CH_3D7) TaxID=1276538 RepID=A0A1X7RSK0_ZYMT9|nr:unnamed protein product [Zymoseptoria tritici ST99CH_3D7]SMR53273.1 unnamed protein product [Zymoseptoria tritici ST99CH_3D1]